MAEHLAIAWDDEDVKQRQVDGKDSFQMVEEIVETINSVI